MIATRRLLVGAGAPLYELVTGRRPWTEYRRCCGLQWRSPEELDALALERVRPLLQHAADHVPYSENRAELGRIHRRPITPGRAARPLSPPGAIPRGGEA